MKRLIFVFFLCSLKIFGEFSWTTPSLTISSSGSDNNIPQVKMDNYGNVLAMWVNIDNIDLMYNFSLDYGVSWPTEFILDSTLTGADAEFSFDLNNAGQATVCYTLIYQNSEIYYRKSTDSGGTWSARSTLATGGVPTPYARHLYVDINESGIAALAYSNYQVYVRVCKYDATIGVYGNDYLSTATGVRPCVVVNNNGKAVVAFSDPYNPGNDSLITLAGTWAAGTFGFSETQRSNNSSSSLYLAMNDAGFAVIVNYGLNLGFFEVHSTNAGVNFSSPNLLSSATAASLTQCAVDDNGYASIVWVETDGTNNRIVETHTINYGNNWSSLNYLSAAGQNADDPIIASDKLGNTFVSWYRSNGTNDIRQITATYDNGTTWQDIVNISATGLDAGGGSITMDSTGHVVVAFLMSDGSDDLVDVITGKWTTLYVGGIYVGIKTEVSKRNVNFFLTKELVHTINWEKIPFAVRYHLYKHANLEKRLATTTTLEYEVRNSKIGDQYYLTWEDNLGVERDSTKIILE